MPPTLRAALAVLLLSACAGSPPGATSPSAAPPTNPARVSVIVVNAPEGLIIDGDLAEWGSLAPPIAGSGGKPGEPIPRGAASHVAVAVTGDGARIAADLGEAAREGIWLGIGVTPAEMPPVGEHTVALGTFYDPEIMAVTKPAECLPPPHEEAPPDPESSPACRAFRAARAAMEAAYERRFRRLYRIDRDGVRVVGEDGALAAVAGARAVFKASAHGAKAEVSLPALALPRLSEAPLTRIRLWPRIAGAVKPPEPPVDTWVSLDLPAPVGFEPLAALRAQAFAVSRWMSYQPGDPLHVEAMRYPDDTDRRSIAMREEALYAKQAALGDTEIGYLTIARRLTGDDGNDLHLGRVSDRVGLAVVTKGAVALAPIEGTPVAVVEHDGELHAISLYRASAPTFDVTTVESFRDAVHASWSVTGVGPEGKRREVALDDTALAWDEVEEVHDEGSFGLRGLLAAWATEGETPGHRTELRWRWDPGKKRYGLERKNLGAAP